MVAGALGTTVGAPPIGPRRWRLPFEVRSGFCNLRNFRKRYANQGFGVHPLGETAKLRTVSRAEFLQGVSASFRRFPPLRAIVGKAPFS
jgi:hypothetical protein